MEKERSMVREEWTSKIRSMEDENATKCDELLHQLRASEDSVKGEVRRRERAENELKQFTQRHEQVQPPLNHLTHT